MLDTDDLIDVEAEVKAIRWAVLQRFPRSEERWIRWVDLCRADLAWARVHECPSTGVCQEPYSIISVVISSGRSVRAPPA